MSQPSLKNDSDIQSVKNAINELRDAVNAGDISFSSVSQTFHQRETTLSPQRPDHASEW